MRTINQVTRLKFSETARGDGELNPIPIKEFLAKQYENAHAFGTDNLKHYGVYRLLGFQYDFKPFLKKYYFMQYGTANTAYAPNVKLLKRVVGYNIKQVVRVTE